MDESQILQGLRAIGEEIAVGKPPHVIFDSIVEAVRALGFDRVSLDLLSPDGTFVTPTASRGSDGEGLGAPIPVGEDPDIARLLRNLQPQVDPGSNGTGTRGIAPLILRGRLAGKLIVDQAAGGRPISSAELATVLLFAQQAAFAQAMLWAGSLESLQQTTLNITSVRDPRTLLNTIVEQAVKLLGAQSGGIYEYRPEMEELVIIADYKRPYVGRKLALGQGMAGRIIQERLPHMVVQGYNRWHGRAELYGDDRSFEAVLEVPLCWQGNYIGVLYVDDKVGRTFSDADIHVLRLFADQAAICMANANLLQSDAKKLQRLEQLARATQEMMDSLGAMSLRERLDLIARRAAELLDAETSGVFLLRSGMLVLEASFGHLSEFEPGKVPPLRIHDELGGGLTGWIAYHGKLFKDHGKSLKRHPAAAHLQPHVPSRDCYSLLAIPLVRGTGRNEELVGLIRTDNKKGGENDRALATLGFSQEDEWILTIFAEAAIVAIDSAELVNRLKEQDEFRSRLISSSPGGIIAVDDQGRVTEFNRRAEEILGYSHEEILGQPVMPLYLDPHEPKVIGKKLHGEPDHHVRNHKTFVRSKAGEVIPILHSSTWLLDAAGNRVGSVGYFVDLREQRELERRERLLLRASKALAEPARLADGLQRLAEMMVLELGRSFCSILLMDESGEFLTLRAESLKQEPDWRSRGQRIVLAEWKGLSQLLVKGEPRIQQRSDSRARSILEKLTEVLGFEREIERLLIIPLKIGARVVGQLALGDFHGEERAASSEEEIDLASALAAQITGLIQRFQLLETTVRREKLLKALVEASPHIQAGAEIKTLQQVIVRLATELVGCRIGGLFRYRSYLGQLELVAVQGAPAELVGEQLGESEGLVGTAARTGETAFSHDPQEDLFFRSLELKSVAVVPFRRGSGEVEAVLFIGDSQAREPFSLIDQEILDAFAAQATIALDTARLMDREQLYGRQMATLHRISDYIQQADTLEKIVHSVLTGITASYGLGFNRAVLLLVDETGDFLVGEMGIGEADEEKAREAWRSAAEIDDFERYLRRREKNKIPETTVGRKIRGLRLPIRESGIFSEALLDGKHRSVPPSQFDRVPRPFLRSIQARTSLEVAPLTAKGQVIGLLVADNKFTQAPVGEDLSNALMTFASTAAVAIENKRLLDQTRSGAEKLMAFYRMSGELIGLSEPRAILERIVAQTMAAAGASWVSILLIDKAGRAINAQASPHVSLDESATLLIRPEGISMRVMKTGQAFPIENVGKMREQVNPVLMRRSVQAAICLPMSLPGKPLGVMWIHYNQPHRFPESEVAALQLYVNQAAIAYESSRRTETLENIRATFKTLAEVDDMTSLLDRIVRGAQRVLKADEAVLWLYDAKTDSFIPESSTYAGDHPSEWSELQKSSPEHRGTAYRIMEHTWMGVEDLQDPEQKKLLGPKTLRFLEQIHGCGFQGAALKVGREKLGVLYAIYLKPCCFEEEERETALAFANHAALSLKKAKLLDQIQRAREAAEVVARVTLLEDPKHTLLSIAQETKRALACGAVVLFQYDEDTGALLHPTTMTGVIPRSEDILPDHSLVLAMVERDGPYIVQDVRHDEKFKDSTFAVDQGLKSSVAVPLKAAGRRVGVMFINYRNQRHFTADELTNIELFANQAAVAIRNIQLFEESATKLRQQETLAELSRELLLARSVQDTMDRAVEFAARVLETELANIVLPNREGLLVFSAGVGWPPHVAGTYLLERGEGSQTGYTIRKREPVAVYDFSAVKEFRVPQMILEQGIHSGLSVPMFLGGRIVGAMLVHTKRPRRFTEDDKILLSLIANQTATALERARQYETIRRKSLYLEALYDVAKAITAQAGKEQRQILDEIVPKMGKLVGVQGPAPVLGSILLYNEDTDELVTASVHPKEQAAEIEQQFGRRLPKALHAQGERTGVTGRAVLTRTPQLVKDVMKDPDYIPCPEGVLSELAMPLIDRDRDKVIGVLSVKSEQVSAFDEDDLDALKALAELVVIAILNARRVEELGTQTALAWMGLGNAVSRHELNNHVGALKVQLYLLEEDLKRPDVSVESITKSITEIEQRLQSLDQPVGRLDMDLSTILVNEELIVPSVSRIKESASAETVKVLARCELADAAQVRGNATWLIRVLDIFINNSVAAGAKTIVVGSRTGRRQSHAEIYVEDDGRGISDTVRGHLLRSPIQKPKGSRGTGTGLLLAKAIAQVYGGSIEWKDREPRGTIMVLALPLEERGTEETRGQSTDSSSAARPSSDAPAGTANAEEKFKGRILMVDDDQTILALYSDFLERKGYHVTTAVNLPAAKRPLDQGGVDLLITDLRVKDDESEQDISGFEFAYPFSPSLPIIVFTGHKDSIEEIVRSIERERQPTAPRILVVSKKSGQTELLRAVEAAMENHYPAVLKPVQREKALAGINTAYYIPRAAEAEVIERLQRMEYLLISEPRQQGKTSLVSFLVRNPPSDRMIFSYVDVSGFQQSSAEIWIEVFRERVRRSLEQSLSRAWYSPQGAADMRAFLVLLGTALEVAGRQLVIAVDEVDPASSGLRLLLRVLRDVYNSRQFEKPLGTFAFLFLGTFHPDELVATMGTVPFNVTQRVRLPDFDVKETTLLVRRRVSSDVDAAVIAARVFYWASGQPYLTQMLCSSLRDGSEPDEVDKVAKALRCNDRNHFPLVMHGLLEDAEASTLAGRILTGERIRFSPDSSQVQRKLELLGVIVPDNEGDCKIRNRLCAEMLSTLLGGEAIKSKKQQPRRRRSKENRWLPRKYRVLFLSAEPTEGASIWADKEIREVQQHTRHARRPVIIIPQLALRLRDLNQAIFEANAQIIHFSGHGSSTGDLYFEDDMKRAQLFETAKLAATLPYIARNLKCVVLNACFSARQAESVAQRIEYVIGMRTKIESEDAVTFSRVFYEQLGFGKSFEAAFQVARVQSWSGALPANLTDLPPVLFRDGEMLNLDEEVEAS